MVIDILGEEWEISEAPNTAIELVDGPLYGATIYFDQRIVLNEALNDQQAAHTLRHELTHAFIHVTQIINQEKEFDFTEEMLCEFVGMWGGRIADITNEYMRSRKHA